MERKHIVIVEDNPHFSLILETRLEKAGFDITTAEDGLKGYHLIRQMKPDLIILDLMLPTLDGQKICRFLKFDRMMKEIPIIIFTSRDLDEQERLAKQGRADAYVLKTTPFEVLLNLIHRLLKIDSIPEKFETHHNSSTACFIDR